MIEITVSRKRKITTAKYENEEVMAAIKSEFLHSAPIQESMDSLNEELEIFLNVEEKKIRDRPHTSTKKEEE